MTIDQTDPRFSASSAYRRYVLVLLVMVGIVAWIDRNVFAILLQSIKIELGFSDTQLGLLGGVAFGLFYATVGLPVAWLADRYNRRSVLAMSLAAWSAMTALCGFATGFVTLFLARLGVGIGEAGGTPPSHSLISDYFGPERRGFALGVFSLYIPLGFVLGFLAGGWLNEMLGWRATLVIVGLPGIVLALLLRLTLREPPRGLSEHVMDTEQTPPLWATIRHFSRRPSLRHLPLGGAIHGIGAFAAAVWLPAYFIRAYGITSAEAGAWMALAYGFGGGTGVLLGGFVADRIVRRSGDQRWYAWGSAVAIASTMPFAALVYLTNQPWIVILSLLVATAFGHMFLGPAMAMMQSLAGLRRRAMAAAYYLFLVNFISMGLGPVLVGIASDNFNEQLGADALRYALLAIAMVTSLWAAMHFVLAGRTLREDVANANANANANAHVPSSLAAPITEDERLAAPAAPSSAQI